MIQSPCLNCPNRYKDKRLCMDTCVLLHRVHTFQLIGHLTIGIDSLRLY